MTPHVPRWFPRGTVALTLLVLATSVLAPGMYPAPRGTLPVVEASEPSPKEITLVGRKLKFHPDTIATRVDEPITVRFKNDGFVSHSFHVKALDVQSKTIAPGESTTVTFTPTETGSFTFTCEVAEHKIAGMKGTLTVSKK